MESLLFIYFYCLRFRKFRIQILKFSFFLTYLYLFSRLLHFNIPRNLESYFMPSP